MAGEKTKNEVYTTDKKYIDALEHYQKLTDKLEQELTAISNTLGTLFQRMEQENALSALSKDGVSLRGGATATARINPNAGGVIITTLTGGGMPDGLSFLLDGISIPMLSNASNTVFVAPALDNSGHITITNGSATTTYPLNVLAVSAKVFNSIVKSVI